MGDDRTHPVKAQLLRSRAADEAKATPAPASPHKHRRSEIVDLDAGSLQKHSHVTGDIVRLAEFVDARIAIKPPVPATIPATIPAGGGEAPAGTGFVSVADGRFAEPRWLAKSDVGLGNVDNTSDANKPVSTATQTALDGKETAGAAAAAQSAAAADATAKANAARADACALCDPAGAAATVQGNLSSHTAATTGAHGGIVASTDARLSDARTPTAHSHAPGEITGTAVVTTDPRLSDARAPTTHSHTPGDVTGTAVVTNDARLSDARTPLTHSHSPSDVTGTAVVTNDARLSDARTPLTHSHAPVDITGTAVVTTDARLSDARAPTQHAITDSAKHSSTATTGNMLKADANGLPVAVTNTDTDVADAVAKRHANTNDPSAPEKAAFAYPLIFVPNSQRVFRSMADVATAGFLTISGTAYFVYMGRVGPAAITPKYVRAYLRVVAASLTVAEAGIFSTPEPPNFAASQSVSKLAAVATWDSLTSGLGMKKSGQMSTSVAAGTHLWAGFRAQFSTMPNFTGLIYDNRSGEILVTASAAAFSTAGPWTGVLVAAQTSVTPAACCPELMLTLD